MRSSFPFAGAFDERIAKALSAQTCVNWYPEVTETHGKQTMILKTRPGLRLVNNLGAGPHRGSYVHGGNMYVVVNNSIYKIDIYGTATLIGTINTNTGNVGMASSGQQLVIVDGIDGWVIAADVLTQITDLDFVDATQVKFLDGFFIVNKPGTGQFYISDIYDAFIWQIIFSTAEVDPDNLLAIEIDHQELWLFGEYVTELYFNAGLSPMPFAPQQGGSMEWGIVAPWSIAKNYASVNWIAQNRNGGRQIVSATGFQPRVISSPAIEEQLDSFGRVDDALGFCIKLPDSHIFYVVSFPSANKTFVYDFVTNLWHSWESGSGNRFKINTHCYFNGFHYMGDSDTGNLYIFDSMVYEDNDSLIIRSRKTIHVSNNMNQVTVSKLDLTFNSGQLIDDNVTDALVTLYVSKDGGNTWGNARTKSIGKIGQYRDMVSFPQLGTYRQAVYELRTSANMPLHLIGANAEIFMGDS